MVSVDYDYVARWLEENKVNRRQLCTEIGLSESTLAASFRRKSKMQVIYVWRMADFMRISPAELLLKDADGRYSQEELELVKLGRARYEENVEDDAIDYVVSMMKDLNADGIQEARRLISLLREVPSLRKTPKL